MCAVCIWCESSSSAAVSQVLHTSLHILLYKRMKIGVGIKFVYTQGIHP